MKDFGEKTRKILREAAENFSLISKDESLAKSVARAAELIISSLRSGRKVITAGNGGSAADAQHMVAELVGRFSGERKPLKAVALTVNTSTITALANDYDFEQVFARQIDAIGEGGDVFIGITTSGMSKNIISALKKAKEKGLVTIGLLGRDGGEAKELCDIPIVVPNNSTPRIQEAHIMIIHALCELIDENFREE